MWNFLRVFFMRKLMYYYPCFPRKPCTCDKMDAKELWEAFCFACTSGFWRMSILWTFSLIMSYLQLFSQRFSHEKLTSYARSSPTFHPPATVSVPSAADALRRPVCVITGVRRPIILFPCIFHVFCQYGLSIFASTFNFP